MRHTLENGVLTIHLPERIDTSTIGETEVALLAILNSVPHTSLVFDASALQFISSVGLRLVLKCKKDDTLLRIENVSTETYDIFEMTGFTQILDIQKRFREISIAGCPLIGKGAYGKVYRLSPDTIVKSYFRGNPVADIERERNLAKQAFVLGIPTAISYDIVRIKEEKLGAVYELIEADSLLDALRKSPSHYDEYLKQYIALLDQMRHTHIQSDMIPSYKDDLRTRITRAEKILDPSTLAKLSAFVESLPDSDFLLHGDCHFKNLFSTPDGLLLIDMDTLSKGEPFYELACLYKTYITFNTVEPMNAVEFFGVEHTFCEKLFEDVFEGLYKGDPDKEEIRKKIELVGWFMYVSHACRHPERDAKRIQEGTKYLLKAMDALGL
ncbi:MAG: phosphotransferase [Bacilli bacterium]|nr:phosphotransferase [Bacilli bacterium]